MLFSRNALASGPQACFLAEKRLAKVKVGKLADWLDISPQFVSIRLAKRTLPKFYSPEIFGTAYGTWGLNSFF